jgi:hypothetical protein
VGAAVATCLAWGSAGLAPLVDAATGALRPSDLPTDFVPAARRARGAPPGTDVATGNAEARAAGAPAFVPVGAPYRAHPPPAVMVVRPLVALGFRRAALAWLALSLASLAVLAWLVTGVFVPDARRRFIRVWPVFGALLLWPPVLHNLEKGQWSLPIAALLALAFAAAGRGARGRAGALIAAAACFKITPALVLFALLRRPGRVLVGAAAATAGLALLSLAVMGTGYWGDFLRSSGENATGWQTAPANTLSLWGVTSRLLIGGAFARPALVSPAAARAVWMIGALLLSGTAVAVTWPRSRPVTPDAASTTLVPARVFAAWSALAVILGPLAWTHTAIWLVLPGALLLRDLIQSPSRQPLRALALLAALVLLTIPRLSLFALAGPLPVAPWRGLFLALHLLGALLVFAAACLGDGAGAPGAPRHATPRVKAASRTPSSAAARTGTAAASGPGDGGWRAPAPRARSTSDTRGTTGRPRTA